MASDLPLRVAFPILFHNALEWFHPQRTEFPVRRPKPAPRNIAVAERRQRGGNRRALGPQRELAMPSVPLVFADTSQAGFYSFKSAGREAASRSICSMRKSRRSCRG